VYKRILVLGFLAVSVMGLVWFFNSVQGHQLQVENRTAQTITVGAEDGTHYLAGHIRASESAEIEGLDFVGRPSTIVIEGHGFSEVCDYDAAKENEPLVIDGIRLACSDEDQAMRADLTPIDAGGESIVSYASAGNAAIRRNPSSMRSSASVSDNRTYPSPDGP
jgi:hypothetical protein